MNRKPNSKKWKDLSGERFGKLIAIRPTGEIKYYQPVWSCQCDCGAIHDVVSYSLIRGNTKSCGCARKEHMSKLGQHVKEVARRKTNEP